METSKHELEHEVAERQRAEEALRESQERIRLVMDTVPVLIAYVDQQRRFRFVSRTYERWFAISRPDIDGKLVRELVGDPAYQVLDPYIDTVLSGQEVAFEVQVPYQHGGARYVSAKYVPHVNLHGDVQGYFALVEDISRRKAMEEELLKARKIESVGVLADGIAHDFKYPCEIIFIRFGFGRDECIANARFPEEKI